MDVAFSDRVKASGLPLNQIIVIGSGILDTLGIRKTADVDLAVSDELYVRLLNDSLWQKKLAPWGEVYMEKGECEVWRGWILDHSGHPDYSDLLKDSTTIDGIRYTNLDYLLQWKKLQRRPKDMRDIELIEAYRTN